MTTATYHLTLGRLHKLVERVRARIGQLHAEMARHLATQKLVNPLEKELSGILQNASEALLARETAEVLSRELARLRGIIATENARLGVNEALAMQDVLKQHLSYIQQAIASSAETGLKVSDVCVGADFGEYGRPASPLSAEEVAQLKAKAKALENEIFGLSDAVADRNATKVSVQLSEEVSQFLAA